jgi:4-hydroxy-tetrahydrodipicolinate synthase
MTKDFTFDEAGIRENIEAYIEMGETGLVVGGFIAECWNVKLSDWMRYHEIVADAVKGRMDLWTIILDPSVHQALEKMKFVEELGYHGAEVINPVVQLKTDKEIFNYFKYMTDHSDLAISLYRTPVSGTLLSFDLVKKLGELETTVAVKQGHLNHPETLKLREFVGDSLVIIEPWERYTLDDYLHGGQAIYGELSYILYGKQRHLMKEYMDLAKKGDFAAAYPLSEKLEPARSLYDEVFLWEIARSFTYASALAYLKTWYEAIGLKAGSILPPKKNLSEEQKEKVKEAVRKIGVV